jgi:quinol monooxygenase YgiN
VNIAPKSDEVTLVNVFTVDPKEQQRLVALLTQATSGLVSAATGFIGASLLRSTDGTKVTMVSRWRSEADYAAMRSDPRQLPFLKEALTFARFEPGIYRVERTFEFDGPAESPPRE